MAIPDFSAAIGLKPTAEAYRYRGIAFANKADYDKAVADLSEAIRLQRKGCPGVLQPGRRLRQEGREGQGEEDLTRAKELGYIYPIHVLFLRGWQNDTGRDQADLSEGPRPRSPESGPAVPTFLVLVFLPTRGNRNNRLRPRCPWPAAKTRRQNGAKGPSHAQPHRDPTTARLIAEAITPLHFHDLHRLLSDPQVMKTLSADGKPLAEEAIGEQNEQNLDIGGSTALGSGSSTAKKTACSLAGAGLKTYQIDGKEAIGLAYAVMSEYWNQGFATEMAQAGLEVGFGRPGLSRNRFMDTAGQSGFATGDGETGVPVRAGFRVCRAAHRFYRLAAGEWTG